MGDRLHGMASRAGGAAELRRPIWSPYPSQATQRQGATTELAGPGTDSSNPSPSSGESATNYAIEVQAGASPWTAVPEVQIHLSPALQSAANHAAAWRPAEQRKLSRDCHPRSRNLAAGRDRAAAGPYPAAPRSLALFLFCLRTEPLAATVQSVAKDFVRPPPPRCHG